MCNNAFLTDAGWSSLAARRAHNPKVAGSNPAPATKQVDALSTVLSGAPRESQKSEGLAAVQALSVFPFCFPLSLSAAA